eukprot:scaffold301866_cov26-Tisochrysis_lutea.AAC.2
MGRRKGSAVAACRGGRTSGRRGADRPPPAQALRRWRCRRAAVPRRIPACAGWRGGPGRPHSWSAQGVRTVARGRVAKTRGDGGGRPYAPHTCVAEKSAVWRPSVGSSLMIARISSSNPISRIRSASSMMSICSLVVEQAAWRSDEVGDALCQLVRLCAPVCAAHHEPVCLPMLSAEFAKHAVDLQFGDRETGWGRALRGKGAQRPDAATARLGAFLAHPPAVRALSSARS